MNNSQNKNNFYSFNKQDLIILLSVYNAAFLFLTSIIKGHLGACFVAAVLLSLIVLFAIVWIDLTQKTSEEETELEHEQEIVRKKIRDEYLKVHNKKRKHELLRKAGCIPEEQLPHFLLNKDFGKVKEVHFDYIDDTGVQKNIRGQPEGT